MLLWAWPATPEEFRVMPLALKHFTALSLTITMIAAAIVPVQAAYPDRDTYNLITQRYNAFLEGTRDSCVYYGNLDTLAQDRTNRRMSVLNMMDRAPGQGRAMCGGTFEFLNLVVNCSAQTAYYSPFVGSPLDYDRQKQPTQNAALIDYICRLPVADSQGDYPPLEHRTLASGQGEWEVVSPEGLNCRNLPQYQTKDFWASLNYDGDLLKFLKDDPQGVSHWDITTTLKQGTKLTAYTGPLGIHTLYRDRQNQTWLPVVLGDDFKETNVKHCFVRANQQYIRPVFQSPASSH
jgi:hypothetical protein